MCREKTLRLAELVRVVVLTLAAALVLVLALAGCGGGDSDGDSGPAGTAAERAAQILGAEPTGVAGEIIDRGYMIVADDADYAPQSSIDEATGELVGFDVDVAKRVAEILGLEARFKNPEWETVPTGLGQGRYDVSIGSMSVTPEHDAAVDLTQPYYYAPAQVFVREGGSQIGGVADLAGKRVGVSIATAYYDYLTQQSDAVVKTYGTDEDLFSDLRKGRLDFVLTAGTTGQQAILEGEPFEVSGAPLYDEPLAFAVAEGEIDWQQLLDHAIASMHEDGSLSSMSKTWFDGLDLTVAQ